eukprot:6264683-Prymnesium_polylepis.1
MTDASPHGLGGRRMRSGRGLPWQRMGRARFFRLHSECMRRTRIRTDTRGRDTAECGARGPE